MSKHSPRDALLITSSHTTAINSLDIYYIYYHFLSKPYLSDVSLMSISSCCSTHFELALDCLDVYNSR